MTGERFSSLRRRMQLERASSLLRSSTSVKEAALGAGFSEPAYFSRVFARRFGVPPSRWREALS
jgi:AraC-like DNA-binding protein